MSNTYNALLAVQFMTVTVLMIECIYIRIRARSDLQESLFFCCVVNLVNNTGYLFVMTSTTPEGYMIGNSMSYLGRIWVPFSLFLFTLKLCRIRYKKRIILALALFEVFVYFTVITSGRYGLYYSSKKYVTEGLFPHMEFGHGITYKLQSALIICFIVIAMTMLIYNVIKEEDKRVKERFAIITSSIAIESSFFIMQLLKLAGTYDLTMMGYAIGSVIMCVGIFKYDILSTMDIAMGYVIDEIPEVIVVTDTAGNIVYVNERAKNSFDLVRHVEENIKKFDEAAKTKEPIMENGRVFYAEKKEVKWKGSNKTYVYVLEDDTELFESNRAMREQKDIAEIARKEAENANNSKSAFLSMVSHEIRTPMNAVVGMTDLMLENHDNLTVDQLRYLKNIKNSGSSLVMLVNDILDLSKIEAGKIELIEEEYRIRDMIEDVEMIIQNRIGSKPIELKIAITQNVPEILIGDSLRIRQVLINLMNNAVKYTDSGYIKLTVRCTKSEKDRYSIAFCVEDTGQGIKPKDMSKLGEAFGQVDTKKNHFKEGTGLGLSISRNFVDMMGGTLDMYSVYGQGTSFSFTIWQGRVRNNV